MKCVFFQSKLISYITNKSPDHIVQIINIYLEIKFINVGAFYFKIL